VTSSPDTSARETPRAAPMYDGLPDRIEAVADAVGIKDQLGNNFVSGSF